jgi:hypothetical protein
VTTCVDSGADHIRDALFDEHARTGPSWRVPARSTINRVLGRNDRLQCNPKKRPRSSWRRFVYARPRDCYRQDGTEVTLADGRKAVIFDVLDDRYLAAMRSRAADRMDLFNGCGTEMPTSGGVLPGQRTAGSQPR